jgi:uncharacterized protein (DUF983 family)
MLDTLVSLVKCKCPRCHTGNLFVSKNPYNLKKITDMPEKCSFCGQLTTPEPAFYYGAMYSSYFICVFIFFINFLIMGVYLNFSGLKFSIVYTIELLILMPLIFRYARVTYIYMFVSYDPDSNKKNL